jgi:proteasome lid subunit RPN8/RPN11
MKRRIVPVPRVRASAIGRLLVTGDAVRETLKALKTFSDSDGKLHEGLVFLAGRKIGDCTFALSAVVPESRHEPFRVIANEHAVGLAARAVRELAMGLVAQVHSHPSKDTNHSTGDDMLILMPFEGMFSLVVASYGYGSFEPSSGLGVHQFQDGKWVEIDPMNRNAVTVIPSVLDLRER